MSSKDLATIIEGIAARAEMQVGCAYWSYVALSGSGPNTNKDNYFVYDMGIKAGAQMPELTPGVPKSYDSEVSTTPPVLIIDSGRERGLLKASFRIKKIISGLAVLLVAYLASVTQATWNTGAGTVYKLRVKQDIALERGSYNWNNLVYLLVSKHPQYPNKRSLVQFEDLPSSCALSQIQSAKMYLYFVYAHIASWHSIQRTPFIPRYMQVHMVKKSWKEAQATSTYRFRGHRWSTAWLGLDNTDAEAEPQSCSVPIFPYRPPGFVEFDITRAVQRWRSGVPNHGLVIRATNELEAGRGIRFASNAMNDATKHAFVLVLCSP